jgi:tetratricopeptide (TPR) repeat protein
MGSIAYQALCTLPLGEALLLAGRLEEAHALAERALAHARQHQEHGNQAYTLRLLGESAARCDPLESESAETHYRQALALADELGMRPLVAHCHLGLGTLYAATGQREPAHTALSAAIALYRAMDMTFWLPQAEAALAQVEGASWTIRPSWQRCLPSSSRRPARHCAGASHKAAPGKFEAERFASKAQKCPINLFTWSAIPPRTSRVLL